MISKRPFKCWYDKVHGVNYETYTMRHARFAQYYIRSTYNICIVLYTYVTFSKRVILYGVEKCKLGLAVVLQSSSVLIIGIIITIIVVTPCLFNPRSCWPRFLESRFGTDARAVAFIVPTKNILYIHACSINP